MFGCASSIVVILSGRYQATRTTDDPETNHPHSRIEHTVHLHPLDEGTLVSKQDESQAVNPRARRRSNRAAFQLSLSLGARQHVSVIIVQHLQPRAFEG